MLDDIFINFRFLTNNFQLRIETIREMLSRDVFNKAASDPLADWSEGYYRELLKSLEGGA